MQEEDNKVEIDTDDVEEETVTVEEKPKEIKTEEIEVDLGYTDPVKEGTTAEVVEETKQEKKEDNLVDMTENVQKRINSLTRKMREAERQKQEAIAYAQSIIEKTNKEKKEAKRFEQDFTKEFESRVDTQKEIVKQNLKNAIENNDAEKIMEAQEQLTTLAVEKEKAKIKQKQFEEEKTREEELAKNPPANDQNSVPQPQAEISPKAKAWGEENTWFGNDEKMTQRAFAIHGELVAEGFDAESDRYYNEVDKRMRESFPTHFSQDYKPVQTVASAGRKQQGRRKVTLTRSQVAIAKKLNVPLKLYAKHVKERDNVR
tara:strand:- start:433 stop:1380 length:948 start_codon:yes stop_codon:yes gene_type:complete